MKRMTCLLAGAVLLCAQIAAAQTTITVGKGGGYNYETIQAAIDAATTGDTITVHPATYIENINFKGKNILLRSSNPTDSATVAATIIDANSSGTAVRFAGTETSSCVLWGFTIRNGREGIGGGIHTHALIQDNIITSNATGLANCNGTIVNNTITHNGSNVGGIYSCNGIIRDNVIAYNRSGGVYFCIATIENNLIVENTAYLGGGIAGCRGIIQNNIITRNSATHGGGLFNCSAIIRNNIITENLAQGSGGGLNGCESALVLNNLIVGNRATAGGGMSHCRGGTILNNTIASNSASGTLNVRAGGLYSCQGTIANCIVWGNTATSGPAQLNESSTPTYSCIQNWRSGGTGNIAADPLFATGPLGGYYLNQIAAGQAAQSPCVDAGSSTALEAGLADRTTRTDGQTDTGIVDMGYHYPLTGLLPATIGVEPLSFDVTLPEGIQATTHTFQIWNGGSGTLFYDIATTPSEMLSVQPTSGQSSGERNVHPLTFNTMQRSPGAYTGHIHVTGNATNSPVIVPVRLTVTPQPAPSIAVSSTAFAVRVPEGTAATTGTLQIWNSGGGTLAYDVATSSSSGFLSVYPTSGQSSGAMNTHQVFFSTLHLAAGTYRGHIRVAGNASNSPVMIPVELTVTARQPLIIVSPDHFSITTHQGLTTYTETLAIWNGVRGTLVYSVVGQPTQLVEVRPATGESTGPLNSHGVYFKTAGLPVGNYTGRIVVSGNAINSPVSVPFDVTIEPAGLPNLVFSEADFAPTTPVQLHPGNPIVLSATFYNSGNTNVANAGPFWTEVWGSRTGGLTLDRFLATSLYLPEGLPGGWSYSWFTSEPLYSIPDGPYTVVYAVDRPGDVAESNERDNRYILRGKRVLVIRPQTQADLVVESFAMSPNPAQSGGQVSFSGRVVNRGSEQSGQFWIEFWGSCSWPYPSLDFFLCDSIGVANLDPGAAVDLSNYPRQLYHVPTGVFMVGCFADRDDAINELDETNNYRFVEGQVFNQAAPIGREEPGTLQSAPDIRVVAADFSPAAPTQSAPGDSITFTVHLVNQGSANTGPFWLEYWGSRDGGVTLCDFLTISDPITNLAAGATVRLSSAKPLWSIPDGPYSVVVVADRPNSVVESNKGNNRLTVAGKRLLVMCPPSGANLRLEDFGFHPTSDQPIRGIVRNTGTGDSGKFWIELWVCPGDPDYPWPDRFACDSIYVDNLAPRGQMDLGNFTRRIYDMPTGQYAVIGFVDRLDQVAETDETDNYAFVRNVMILPH